MPPDSTVQVRKKKNNPVVVVIAVLVGVVVLVAVVASLFGTSTKPSGPDPFSGAAPTEPRLDPVRTGFTPHLEMPLNRWGSATPVGQTLGVVAIGGPTVAVIGGNGDIVGFDRDSGAARWRTRIIGDGGGETESLTTGSSTRTPGTRGPGPLGTGTTRSPNTSSADPVRAYALYETGGPVLLARTADLIVGIDPSTGEVRWSMPGDSGLAASPAIAEFFVGDDQSFSSIDPQTGRSRWQQRVGNGSYSAGDDLAVFSDGNLVRAVSRETGEQRWEKRGVGRVQDVLVFGGRVFAVTGTEVITFDGATGEQKARAKVSTLSGSGTRGLLGGSGDTVFVYDGASEVVAVSVADGKERWRAEAKAGEQPSAVVRDDRLVVTGSDGAAVIDIGAGRNLAAWAGEVVGPPVTDGRIVCGATAPEDAKPGRRGVPTPDTLVCLDVP